MNFSIYQDISALKQRFEMNEANFVGSVQQLIREYMHKYDADKTGMTDYALESSGKYKFYLYYKFYILISLIFY